MGAATGLFKSLRVLNTKDESGQVENDAARHFGGGTTWRHRRALL
jgi:hypothetical protein